MNKTSALKAKKVTFRTLTYVLVIAIVVVMIIPTLFVVFLSLLDTQAINNFMANGQFDGMTLQNYQEILTRSNITRWMLNSFIVAITQTVLYVFIASFAAFGFTKLQWKGRNIVFWICMATMLIPGIINMVPNYIIIKKMGLYNNLLAMILPGLSGVFGVYLMRQFMRNIPRDYIEAARMDGASYVRIFFTIVLPMCGPALASLAIFTFQGAWNDFLWPLIITSSDTQLTLTAGLYNYIQSTTDKALITASSIVSAIPIVVVFIFGQRYFTEGLSGGVKG